VLLVSQANVAGPMTVFLNVIGKQDVLKTMLKDIDKRDGCCKEKKIGKS